MGEGRTDLLDFGRLPLAGNVGEDSGREGWRVSRKQYWLKLLYRDFLSDEKVRLLDLEARGLWVSLLCQAACSPRQGYLLLTRKRKPTYAELARIIGANVERTKIILDGTLLPLGLISRTKGGVLYFKNWRKYQQGRTLQPEPVGPKSAPACTKKCASEEEARADIEPEADQRGDRGPADGAAEGNSASGDERTRLFLEDLATQEEKAEHLWNWVHEAVPSLDLNALRRFKDTLAQIDLGPDTEMAIGRLRRDLMNAAHPSSRLMATCKNLVKERPRDWRHTGTG